MPPPGEHQPPPRYTGGEAQATAASSHTSKRSHPEGQTGIASTEQHSPSESLPPSKTEIAAKTVGIAVDPDGQLSTPTLSPNMHSLRTDLKCGMHTPVIASKRQQATTSSDTPTLTNQPKKSKKRRRSRILGLGRVGAPKSTPTQRKRVNDKAAEAVDAGILQAASLMRDMTPDYPVEAIEKHRKHRGEYQFFVKWLGYESMEDRTWETRKSFRDAASGRYIDLYMDYIATHPHVDDASDPARGEYDDTASEAASSGQDLEIEDDANASTTDEANHTITTGTVTCNAARSDQVSATAHGSAPPVEQPPKKPLDEIGATSGLAPKPVEFIVNVEEQFEVGAHVRAEHIKQDGYVTMPRPGHEEHDPVYHVQFHGIGMRVSHSQLKRVVDPASAQHQDDDVGPDASRRVKVASTVQVARHSVEETPDATQADGPAAASNDSLQQQLVDHSASEKSQKWIARNKDGDTLFRRDGNLASSAMSSELRQLHQFDAQRNCDGSDEVLRADHRKLQFQCGDVVCIKTMRKTGIVQPPAPRAGAVTRAYQVMIASGKQLFIAEHELVRGDKQQLAVEIEEERQLLTEESEQDDEMQVDAVQGDDDDVFQPRAQRRGRQQQRAIEKRAVADVGTLQEEIDARTVLWAQGMAERALTTIDEIGPLSAAKSCGRVNESIAETHYDRRDKTPPTRQGLTLAPQITPGLGHQRIGAIIATADRQLNEDVYYDTGVSTSTICASLIRDLEATDKISRDCAPETLVKYSECADFTAADEKACQTITLDVAIGERPATAMTFWVVYEAPQRVIIGRDNTEGKDGHATNQEEDDVRRAIWNEFRTLAAELLTICGALDRDQTISRKDTAGPTNIDCCLQLTHQWMEIEQQTIIVWTTENEDLQRFIKKAREAFFRVEAATTAFQVADQSGNHDNRHTVTESTSATATATAASATGKRKLHTTDIGTGDTKHHRTLETHDEVNPGCPGSPNAVNPEEECWCPEHKDEEDQSTEQQARQLGEQEMIRAPVTHASPAGTLQTTSPRLVRATRSPRITTSPRRLITPPVSEANLPQVQANRELAWLGTVVSWLRHGTTPSTGIITNLQQRMDGIEATVQTRTEACAVHVHELTHACTPTLRITLPLTTDAADSIQATQVATAPTITTGADRCRPISKQAALRHREEMKVMFTPAEVASEAMPAEDASSATSIATPTATQHPPPPWMLQSNAEVIVHYEPADIRDDEWRHRGVIHEHRLGTDGSANTFRVSMEGYPGVTRWCDEAELEDPKTTRLSAKDIAAHAALQTKSTASSPAPLKKQPSRRRGQVARMSTSHVPSMLVCADPPTVQPAASRWTNNAVGDRCAASTSTRDVGDAPNRMKNDHLAGIGNSHG